MMDVFTPAKSIAVADAGKVGYKPKSIIVI